MAQRQQYSAFQNSSNKYSNEKESMSFVYSRKPDVTSSLEVLHHSRLPRIQAGQIQNASIDEKKLSRAKIAHQTNLIDQYLNISNKNQIYMQNLSKKKNLINQVRGESIKKNFIRSTKLHNLRHTVDIDSFAK